MIRREISFFDDDVNNGVGFLSAKLATDADLVQGLMGQLLGSIVQTSSTIIAGLVIAFINVPNRLVFGIISGLVIDVYHHGVAPHYGCRGCVANA
jgi:hypothetical protein